jgi:hypothetical protein
MNTLPLVGSVLILTLKDMVIAPPSMPRLSAICKSLFVLLDPASAPFPKTAGLKDTELTLVSAKPLPDESVVSSNL